MVGFRQLYVTPNPKLDHGLSHPIFLDSEESFQLVINEKMIIVRIF